MKNQRRRDTKPELELRRSLHALGLRYRVDRKPIATLGTRADIVFGPAKVAVFVDGCFWHSCPEHLTIPKNNRHWWVDKLEANKARDLRVNGELHEAGWIPIRIWEHEDVAVAARRIAAVVGRRG